MLVHLYLVYIHSFLLFHIHAWGLFFEYFYAYITRGISYNISLRHFGYIFRMQWYRPHLKAGAIGLAISLVAVGHKSMSQLSL